VALLAVKPQMMGAALPALQALGNGRTLFISIAAGTSIATFEAALGDRTPIVRTMPNTPAMVGRGITGICANVPGRDGLPLARTLMQAVGEVVELDGEHQIDAVTGVSGSGPAYVFHLIEAMAAAGVAEGLSSEVAMKLARATVCGAGELAYRSPESASQLRINVTSPGGTTAAALAHLMDPDTGLPPLVARAVHAATERGRELGK
jgi:pyrroline-5-carboxylate reductase